MFSVIDWSSNRTFLVRSIEHDVLENRPEHLRRFIDVWLPFRRQIDHLRVAAAFIVERAGGRPAVLVVADERALGIGGQRGLAGSGEAEEQRGVARFADVRGAVHREHALLRHVVVHDGEHRLLELTGVARARDEDHPLREVEHDGRARARAVLCRIGLELRRVEHREVRIERRQLGGFRTNEHVPHERHLPRVRRDVADGEAVLGIGAAVEVLHEQLVAPIQVFDDVRAQRLELLLGERLVDLAPVDVRFGRRFFDEEFVVRRAAGMRRRHGAEGAHVGELSFATSDRVLDERRRNQVPVHGARRRKPLGRQSVFLQTFVALRRSSRRHHSLE